MYRKINDFIDKYKSYYKDFIPLSIRKKIKYGYHCDTDQIFCHLNIVKKNESAYYRFLKILKSYFNLRTLCIAELSCGLIPILSSTAKRYTRKNITAISNKILFKNYKSIETIETDLTKNFDLTKFDLIIAFRPCFPTENIIDLCFQYKKDFAVYLCPCIFQPKDSNKKFESTEQWHNYLIKKVRNNKAYSTSIIKSDRLQDDMPIIISKYIAN